MRKFLVSLLLTAIILPVSSHRNYGIYDSQTGERKGRIREHGRYYDIYDKDSERRGYGKRRDGTIEFFDKKGERLPFELRKERR